ncbi:MAG: phosphoribosylglycinamide formyltransferase [Actinomycetota bacterium]
MSGRLVLLASGDGSLAQAIMDAASSGELSASICAVISDKPEARVLSRAAVKSVPSIVHPMKKDRVEWGAELIEIVTALRPDLVVSVGFMRVLPSSFVSKFKVINAHPSLLPKFPGAHPITDVLKAGDKESGATIHWLDDGVDTGPIIVQVKVPILESDDEATLHERIKIVERELMVSTLKNLLPTLESMHG